MNRHIITQVFRPFTEGQAVSLLTGRPIYDLEGDTDGEITTLVSGLCDHAHRQYGMAMVRYSLSSGLSINKKIYKGGDVKKIYGILAEAGITDNKCDSGKCKCEASQEVVNVMRGILQLSSEKKYLDAKWSDGRLLRFLFLLEFSSDVLPEAAGVNQLIADELVYTAAQSVAIRDSGNFVVLNDIVDGKVDSKISNVLPSVSLPYPEYHEKLAFLEVLHRRYPDARLEAGLNDSQVANLSNCTPNRGLEGLFYGSQKTGAEITVGQLTEQKIKDVTTISEGTLSLLDTRRIKDVSLVGATIQVPKDYLFKCAEGLREQRKDIPENILLLGAPGTGKTDLGLSVASLASIPAYGLLSPKAGIVGETERKSKLQMKILRKNTPTVGFIDELSEAFPMQRSNSNLDSGASAAVTAAFLESLSDKSRTGKSILLATSNCGWRIGSAMLDRFTVVPVIMPVVSDFPQIIGSIAKSIVPGLSFDISDERVIKAAEIFHSKTLMPRSIIKALKHAVSIHKSLTPDDILWAAQDAMPLDFVAKVSAFYSDYSALLLCKSRSLLPWSGNANFPFPEYIRRILDDNGDIDTEKLMEEMEKLKPYVNV